MSAVRYRTLKIVLSAALLLAATILGARRGFYDTSVLNVFLAFSLVGFALIYLRVRPTWRDAAYLLAGTALLSLVDLHGLHYRFSVYGILALLGLASIGAIGVRSIWSAGEEKTRMAIAFAFAILSTSANGLAGLAHNWTATLTPKVLDLYLYCFDASLRVQFAFLMGRAYASWHWFRDAGVFVYFGFPLAIAVTFAGQLIRDKKSVLSAMTAFLVTGPIGVAFYAMCPALGPIYLFTSRYPWNPLTMDQASRLILEGLPIAGLRNSMPSLHVAWVLLAWWYSKGLSVWERGLVMCFLVGTVLATLGTGEHYLVDLIAACPFALFIYALCAFYAPWSGRYRVLGILAGLGMTLAWIAVLRFDVKIFWVSPLIPWTACVVTIISAIALRARIAEPAPVPVGGENIVSAPVGVVS